MILHKLSDYLSDLSTYQRWHTYDRFIDLIVNREIYAVLIDDVIPGIKKRDYVLRPSEEFRQWVANTVRSLDDIPPDFMQINFVEITNDNYEQLALTIYGASVFNRSRKNGII